MKFFNKIWLISLTAVFFLGGFIGYLISDKTGEDKDLTSGVADQEVDVKIPAGEFSSKAKNIIFFVGDGMGPAQRELIRLTSVGPKGQIAMNDMPYSGLAITNSTSLVTDSAAGATAMATGEKTNNGSAGVDADGKKAESVLEMAKKARKATGIVSTSEVTDATGAGFGAHVESRDNMGEIAKQYLENKKVDVILGGGGKYFSKALVDKAKDQGYTVVRDTKEMDNAKGLNLLGLFTEGPMYKKDPEREYNPPVSLPDMTKKAINTLSKNKDGFFLLVEEEAIDSFSHRHNAELVIKSGKQLNKAVEVAMEFAKNNPDTLIIVAADHETGGLTLQESDGDSGKSSAKESFTVPNSNKKVEIEWATEDHTAVFVPITAIGPGAEHLTGIYQNTHIFDVLANAIGN